jgi:hypothetical protein
MSPWAEASGTQPLLRAPALDALCLMQGRTTCCLETSLLQFSFQSYFGQAKCDGKGQGNAGQEKEILIADGEQRAPEPGDDPSEE